jgi:Lipocalin-like domain
MLRDAGVGLRAPDARDARRRTVLISSTLQSFQKEEPMKRHIPGAIAAASILCFAPAVLTGETAAQTIISVPGTYSLVSAGAFGENPRGTMILTPDGYYAIILARATLPKIAAGLRTKGTAEENRMVVEGSLAHTGKYTIDDDGKVITFSIQTATFPNLDGTVQKRPLKVSGDTLTYTVTAPSAGGPPGDTVWKRVK